MAAGVFGYLGYDMVREMERLAPAKPDPIGVPDSIVLRPTLMVVFDTVRDEISIVTPVRPRRAYGARRLCGRRAADRRRRRDARGAAAGATTRRGPALRHDRAALEHAPSAISRWSNGAKDYIRAGDIFQVVLSQRFSAPFALPPFALYRALRRVNPAPFLCYLDFGAFQIVCSSPEILVRVRDGTSPSARSPARARAARRRPRTRRSQPTCWRTRRNAPST